MAGDPREFATMVIADAVDGAIFAILDAIDMGTIDLHFRGKSGKLTSLQDAGEGEMAGWYAGGTWIKEYSKERYIDDFADLTLDDDDYEDDQS
jgi:hypothetical protein